MKKLYVVGGSYGYANWMLPLGCEIVRDKNDADIFVFTGGADLDPSFYGEKPGRHTYFNQRRSIEEKQIFDFALENKKAMWGTCLGCQSLAVHAINGAKLIQHISHPSIHDVILPYHGDLKIVVPSCHHQMVYAPEDREGIDYLTIAYSERLSPFHLDGNDQDYRFPENYKEIEGFCIPDKKILGMQTHPEFLNLNHPSIPVIQRLFEQYLF